MTYAAQSNDIQALNDFVGGDPAALEKLAADPQAVLASFGLDIDQATSAALAQNLESREVLHTSAQAAVVHIDF